MDQRSVHSRGQEEGGGRNLGVLGEFTKGRTCREQPDVYYGKAQVLLVGFLQCKIKLPLVDAVLEYVERLW